MADKLFIRADDLVRDAFALARRIFDSGYRPDAMLVLWRGGTPIGIVIHEFFRYHGVDTYHTVVKAESYVGIEQRGTPSVEHMDAVVTGLARDARVLVIDDIFDTGRTVEQIHELLAPRTKHVRVATLYFKPHANQTTLKPDFYLRETDRWIVFPHELCGLSPEDLRRKGDDIYEQIALPVA